MGKVIEHKMRVLISLEVLFERFLILKRNEPAMIKMCIGCRVTYRLFLSDFNEA
jgi:hypothetical protein